jgi:hypothetical protein
VPGSAGHAALHRPHVPRDDRHRLRGGLRAAIFALTKEPLVVFTSNIFAILGLRNLYFLLANAMDKFHMLKYGLGIVLDLRGLKMTDPARGTSDPAVARVIRRDPAASCCPSLFRRTKRFRSKS